MGKLQILRNEVERLKEETGIGLSEHDNGVEQGRMEIINTMLFLIDDMLKEAVSEDTWEASKQYALRQVLASTETKMSEQAYLELRLFSGLELAVAHKDGANWKKEQMMANAVDGAFIRRNRYTKKNVLNGLDMTCDAIQGFRDKDKIKVLFIKEDRLW